MNHASQLRAFSERKFLAPRDRQAIIAAADEIDRLSALVIELEENLHVEYVNRQIAD